ncbi:MAG: hypothetical protein D6814_11720 [Calditrichaeota bacterium]|nr:MAG: hypothetical protein D6814_11720 [Calditrichota bacterium]
MDGDLEKIIRELSDWLDIEGVEGLGQGEREAKPCIVVLVSRPRETFSGLLPEKYRGYDVVLEETGPIEIEDWGE